MKKLILLTLLAFAAISVNAELKVGVVDMQKAFNEYHLTVSKVKELKDKETKMKADSQASMKEQEQVIETILKGAGVDVTKEKFSNPQQIIEKIKNHAVWSETKKATSIATVRKALNSMGEIQKAFQRDVRAEQKKLNELRAKILNEIRGKLAAIAQQKKFDLVLDSSEVTISKVPTVLYTKPSMDITADFIAFLNEGQAK